MLSCIILAELYDRYMYVAEEEVKTSIELARNKCMNYLHLDVSFNVQTVCNSFHLCIYFNPYQVSINLISESELYTHPTRNVFKYP